MLRSFNRFIILLILSLIVLIGGALLYGHSVGEARNTTLYAVMDACHKFDYDACVDGIQSSDMQLGDLISLWGVPDGADLNARPSGVPPLTVSWQHDKVEAQIEVDQIDYNEVFAITMHPHMPAEGVSFAQPTNYYAMVWRGFISICYYAVDGCPQQLGDTP